jgi:hypothetical protein
MLSIPANVSVYLCTKATDMRKGFDGLHTLVLQVFERDRPAGVLAIDPLRDGASGRRAGRLRV